MAEANPLGNDDYALFEDEGDDDLGGGFGSEDRYSEPVGSCEWCGTNLYVDDDEELCSQCAWHAWINRDRGSGGDTENDAESGGGIQPVV